MKKVLDRVSLILMIILLVLSSCYLLCFRMADVVGDSMYPTFNDGDFVLVKKGVDNLKRFDKVVVYSSSLNKKLCKRVIGFPNDTVEIVNGVLKVNNEVIQEDYLNNQDWGTDSNLSVTVGNNEVFVMGDNRNNSLDSRELGNLKLADVDGVIVYDMTKELGITKANLKKFLVVLWLIIIIDLIVSNIRKKKE